MLRMMGVAPERAEFPTGNDDEQRLEEPWVDDVCSEAFLLRETRKDDLASVRSLALTVDTNVSKDDCRCCDFTSRLDPVLRRSESVCQTDLHEPVNHLGIFLPGLEKLRLRRGSTLASFRDFGSSLSGLRVLWVSACGIRHLDGVGALTALEELYLAFNDVEDLTMIAMHDRLEVLDLESNSVRDFDQVDQLGTCPRLSCLTLSANPVCRAQDYRRLTVEAVPHLTVLDEHNVSGTDRDPPSVPSHSPRLDHNPKRTYEAQSSSPLHGHLALEPGAKLPPLLSMYDRSSESDDITSEAASDTFSSGSSCGVPRVTGRGILTPESDQDGDLLDENCCLLGIDSITCHPSASGQPKPYAPPQGALHRFYETHVTSGESLPVDENEGEAQDTLGSPRSERAGDVLGGVGFPWKHARGLRSGNPYNPSKGGCFPEARPSTAWASGTRLFPGDHVDEEELVAEAIKRLRLFPSARKRSLSGELSTPSDMKSASEGAFPEESANTCGRSSSVAAEVSGDVEPPRQERAWEWEDNFEVLKVLGLDDIAGPAGRPERRPCTLAAINAASDLTHGSEVSIAGNPAIGLRRRRTHDKNSG